MPRCRDCDYQRPTGDNGLCSDCEQERMENGESVPGVSRRLSRQEQLEAMADDGIDTWEEYHDYNGRYYDE